MKRFFAALVGAVFVALLTGCGSAPSSGRSVRSKSKGSYFSGDGGKGVSLTVLTPEGKGLSTDLDYLPSMLRGVFVDNFNTYSAITVTDPVNQEKTLMEVEKGIYAEGADVAKYGEVLPSDLFLSGTVTKTSSGYTLQVQITDKKTTETRAAYSGTCTVAELDDFSGVNKASLELLTKLGVQLTDVARAELTGADEANYVQSQTSLARGVTAQRGGSVVAALSFYSEAAAFDPGLAEAGERLAAMTKNIEAGNIGDNIRNEIEQRNAWKKLLEEANEFYRKNSIYDLVYNPAPIQGGIDFDTNEVDIGFDMWIMPNARFDTAWKIRRSYLSKAGSSWGMNGLADSILYGDVQVEVDLLDNTGTVLAYPLHRIHDYMTTDSVYFNVEIKSRRENSKIPPGRFPDSYIISYSYPQFGHQTLAFTVDASRISDTMTLRFKGARLKSWNEDNTPPLVPIRTIATDKIFERYLGGHYYQGRYLQEEVKIPWFKRVAQFLDHPPWE